MESIENLLLERAREELKIKLTSHQGQQFQRYFELLVEWNEKMNLTAITQPEEVVEKHFLDSLSLFTVFSPKEGARVVDVGTGAGFPGIPMKLLRPDLEVTLLDSLNKRLNFLGAVCDELGISCNRVHKRAEEAGRDKAMREGYDVAVARAVAPLNVLAEYCIPLIKMKGMFLAMKGPGAGEELENAREALSLLGGEKAECRELSLGEQERSILLIQKRAFTPKAYPRHGGTISKHPL